MQNNRKTVFISYSRDTPEHELWVAGLAKKLEQVEITALFDQKDIAYGVGKYSGMDKLILAADVILVILTPAYKTKTEIKNGRGVGYEYPIILDQLHEKGKNVIPILRHPNIAVSCPMGISVLNYVDLSTDDKYRSKFPYLVSYIKQEAFTAPPSANPGSSASSPFKFQSAAALTVLGAILFTAAYIYDSHQDGTHNHGHAHDDHHGAHPDANAFINQQIDLNVYHYDMHNYQADDHYDSHHDDHNQRRHDHTGGHHDDDTADTNES